MLLDDVDGVGKRRCAEGFWQWSWLPQNALSLRRELSTLLETFGRGGGWGRRPAPNIRAKFSSAKVSDPADTPDRRSTRPKFRPRVPHNDNFAQHQRFRLCHPSDEVRLLFALRGELALAALDRSLGDG
jgi:hypothetical protein